MTDSPAELEQLIERYNDAWNAQDLDAIHALHAPDIVFENFTLGERAEGAEAVRDHIARIFANSPDLRFTGRRLTIREGLVVNEWTAHVTRGGEHLEWDGVDVMPWRDGLLQRKDVYSGSARPRVVGSAQA